MKNRVFLASVVAFTLAAASAQAQSTLAQWTFENTANTNGIILAPGAGNSSGNVAADNGLNSGFGSPASGKHATAATYSTPAGDIDNGASTGIDGLAPGASGPGLAGSGLAGAALSSHSFSANGWSAGDYFQFQTSTLGFNNIEVAWDQTGSNTGPRDFLLEYSTDGVNFATNSAYSLVFAAWTATSAQGNSLAKSFAGAVDNQATVYFRIVDVSLVSITGGTIGTAGTDRVDNFTVVALPEPSTVALVGAGLFGMLAMRRRRS